jgi:hypothetical protein
MADTVWPKNRDSQLCSPLRDRGDRFVGKGHGLYHGSTADPNGPGAGHSRGRLFETTTVQPPWGYMKY